jgi:hypothetical protein
VGEQSIERVPVRQRQRERDRDRPAQAEQHRPERPFVGAESSAQVAPPPRQTKHERAGQIRHDAGGQHGAEHSRPTRSRPADAGRHARTASMMASTSASASPGFSGIEQTSAQARSAIGQDPPGKPANAG